ncbi:MAG: hypothetical protein ACLTE2_02225 [Eubacteriales bacterium]
MSMTQKSPVSKTECFRNFFTGFAYVSAESRTKRLFPTFFFACFQTGGLIKHNLFQPVRDKNWQATGRAEVKEIKETSSDW